MYAGVHSLNSYEPATFCGRRGRGTTLYKDCIPHFHNPKLLTKIHDLFPTYETGLTKLLKIFETGEFGNTGSRKETLNLGLVERQQEKPGGNPEPHLEKLLQDHFFGPGS